MADKGTIRNIVFDLGGVILDIDIPRTFRAFASLTGTTEDSVRDKFNSAALFAQFETGRLDSPAFRSAVRDLAGMHLDDCVIDLAWNMLLLDIPVERVALIRRLIPRYRVFLLSNTSAIHMEEVRAIFRAGHGPGGIDELFEKMFLSYEMGVMKPDARIYREVLSGAGILPEETLFLDDNEDNVRGAAAAGIRTIHVCKPLTILDYLKDYAD